MPQLSPALRKVAILISALDDRAADDLLDQMGAEQAAKVRSALVELRDIAPDEQQQVLAEFLGRGVALPAASPVHDGGVELQLSEPSLSEEPPQEADRYVVPSRGPLHELNHLLPDTAPFGFLQSVDSQAIASVLAFEHPQTSAAVLVHLSAEQAAEVMQCLPGTLAIDVLERMAHLQELSPVVQADLERALKRQLSGHLGTAPALATALDRVTAVLGAMDYRSRQQLVLQLSERNVDLLQRLGMTPTGQDWLAPDHDGVVSFRYRLADRPASEREAPPPAISANAAAKPTGLFAASI